jgi:hypothetical protein
MKTKNTAWHTSEPPHDGTAIVAIGRVIYQCGAGHEDEDFAVADSPLCCTAVDPFIGLIHSFIGLIHWTSHADESEGWHWVADGLSVARVARTLDDEVKIDFWLEYPR